MSELLEQLVVADHPGYAQLGLHCKVCGYKWKRLEDVDPRDFTVCPAVFYAHHKGGEENPDFVPEGAPLPPAEAPLVHPTPDMLEGYVPEMEDDDDEVVIAEKFDDVVEVVTETFTNEDLTRLFQNQENGQGILSVEWQDITGFPLELLIRRKVRKFYCIVCDKPTDGEATVCQEHAGIIRIIKKKGTP